MSVVEEVTLGVHILTGFLALLAGLVAFATKKGGLRHRQAGKVFVGSMAVVSVTALALYPLEPNFWRLFLALVALFSFYFAFSGYRVLSRKRPAADPELVDWVGVGVMGVAGVGILAMGAAMALDGRGFAPVLLVFGGIGSVFAVSDARTFRLESDPGAWVGAHVTRMGAAYIAAVSAFSAVNFMSLPAVVRWLWPTILGVPLLVYFGRQYEEKFAPS
jgi:uncharacterized membrane protein